MSSKIATTLSIAAITLSVVSIGFTAYKTNADVVYNSIMKNLEKKQKKEMEKQKESADKYIKSNYDKIVKDQPFLGNAKASKIIVKFSDYNCGHCKNAAKVLHQYLQDHNDVKVVIRELPILGKESFDAAVIAHYVFEKSPEKFVSLHSKLTSTESKANALDVAVSLGFSKADIQSALKNEKYKKQISETYQIAQEIGIQGTPAFIIGKTFFAGYLQADVIDAEFKKQK